MKYLLIISAIGEIATGLALLAVPAFVVSILLGGTLNTAEGLATARIAAIALIALGLICWMGSRDTQSRVKASIVTAMLFYNCAILVLFLSLLFGAGMTGIGLLPVSIFHAVLAVWCGVSLKKTW